MECWLMLRQNVLSLKYLLMYVTRVVWWIDTFDYSIFLDYFCPFLIVALAPLSSTVKVKVLTFPICTAIHAVCKYAPSVYLLHPFHMNMFLTWLLWTLASLASHDGFFLRVSNHSVTVWHPCILRSPYLDNVAVFALSQLLTSLYFSLFTQPVKPSWLLKTTFCVTHTAGFIGSCSLSETLWKPRTWPLQRQLLLELKCSSFSFPHLPWGPQMVQGVKLATLQSSPPESPAGHSCPLCPLVISTFGKRCFKPWSALQMMKCHNKTLQVLDRHWGSLLFNHSGHVSFVRFYTKNTRHFHKYRSETHIYAQFWFQEPATMAQFDWTCATNFWVPQSIAELMWDQPTDCPDPIVSPNFTVFY